jgi:hypothetical protein
MPRQRTSTNGRRRTTKRTPPPLTNLETKLGEVIGLAMAAQGGTDKIAKLVTDRDLKRQLKTMKSEAAEAEQGGTAVAASIASNNSSIHKYTTYVEKKATKKMTTYLDRSADGKDGYPFLEIAEAAEVGHWTVLEELNKQAKHAGVKQLTKVQIPIQRRHLKEAMAGSVKLAAKEDATATS